jgi:hypothetical protein
MLEDQARNDLRNFVRDMDELHLILQDVTTRTPREVIEAMRKRATNDEGKLNEELYLKALSLVTAMPARAQSLLIGVAVLAALGSTENPDADTHPDDFRQQDAGM